MALKYLNESSMFDQTASRVRYPNPFFDLSKNYIPKDIKALFKWCRTFFYKNEFINQVIHKLAEYPITDLLFEDVEDRNIKEKYNILFRHQFKIKSLLRDIGLDFYTFGNSFIITSLEFIRWLTCPVCNETFQADKCSEKQVKFQKFKYRGTCPKCNAAVEEFTVEDRELVGPQHLKFLRLNPETVEIDYSNFTGRVNYYLAVDIKIKRAITTGMRKYLDYIPWIFIEAVKESKKIKLDKSNLYHFKASTLAEDDMGWGKPPLLPCLGMIWYTQTLRRANEAIAAEHILPKRMISPASTNSADPFAVDLGRWRGVMEDQLQRWRKDENHVAIMPIPINTQSLGGDGKILMLHQELKFNEENIINALGVPLEFIKGGASWTGSSVSLRIVENAFMNYREDLLDFLNYFVLDKISQFLDYPRIKVKFRKLRMSDDSESKDLALRTASAGWLSQTYLLDELGFDTDADQDLRVKDTKFDNLLIKMRAIAQAEAQGKSQEIMAKSQIKAQLIMQEIQASTDEELFANELAIELKTNAEETGFVIRKLAVQMSLIPPESQQQYLVAMQAQMPLVTGFVMRRVQLMQQYNNAQFPPAEQEMPTETVKTVEKHKNTHQTGASQEVTRQQTTIRPASEKEEEKPEKKK